MAITEKNTNELKSADLKIVGPFRINKVTYNLLIIAAILELIFIGCYIYIIYS